MSEFWFGSEESWDVVVRAQAQVDEMIKQGRTPSEDKNGMPVLWERMGDTALVHISGSLVNGTAGWLRYFGVVGYDDLAGAALAAATDPETKKMLFMVDSGGGAVAGLADYARLIDKVTQLKPSAVYTNTKIGSAAYWSASSVRGPITMDASAEVGSIGTVMVTMERSKQLEQNGIKATVIKSGDLKMMGNPYEPLSDDAKAHMQSQIDDLTELFLAQVKSKRPGMTTANLEQVKRGQTFLGKRAVAVGLADRIGSFEQALNLLDKNSSQKHTSTNSKGATMPKFTITDEQVARLQAGATLAELGIEVDAPQNNAAAGASGTEDVAAQAAAQAAAAQAAAAQAAAAQAAAAPAGAAAGAAGKEGTELVTYLQSQLDAKTAEVATLTANLATANASHAAMKTTHDGLLAIAKLATSNMLVPLGGNSAQVEAMDAAGVIAKHAETKKLFEEKFPIGGRSQAAQADGNKATAPVSDPAFRRLAARHKSN